MIKPPIAIALCRVSSLEQIQNNSLNRQKASILQEADFLKISVHKDGWWSGSISSKKGTNLERKDLKEMLDFCKRNKKIRYLIVDRPDRFMRSIDEAIYYEVEFWKHGVKVWYASDRELNNDNLMSKFLKFTKYFSAEGSNDDRVEQSIGGATKALQEGRYIFAPKPGYMKGSVKGIQEVHPIKGHVLQKILKGIVHKRITPTQGLINLNNSDFMSDGHSLYKMDKFRKIATDPFYAGIIEIDKQVKVRNENGLHEPILSLEEHKELVRIFENKKKIQAGPRKNGNPNFPLSNLVNCKSCIDEQNGRVVGFKHSNGKKNGPVYEKYRCRACKKYIAKKELHVDIERQFTSNPISEEGLDDLIEALSIVWKREEGETKKKIAKLESQIKLLSESINRQIEALSDPKNSLLQDEIRHSIENKKKQIKSLENKLNELKLKKDNDVKRFLKFAFDFIENTGSKFLDTQLVSKENRVRCKQIVFPAGFFIDENKKVYTPEISELYRLASNKKRAKMPSIDHVVRVRGL